ncbi:hypothetical protein GWI33_000011 [Rhynchophorus ferrugineus]|uniref:Uncharacterized protein n=1 Tax=Rhynchophorus ferrugineus TaxID=354439 RepID=A0A834IXB5_RHYFE|nr:hypothetical protein GWI33_000011 [Rhynchophorus ferrugineus]
MENRTNKQAVYKKKALKLVNKCHATNNKGVCERFSNMEGAFSEKFILIVSGNVPILYSQLPPLNGLAAYLRTESIPEPICIIYLSQQIALLQHLIRKIELFTGCVPERHPPTVIN